MMRRNVFSVLWPPVAVFVVVAIALEAIVRLADVAPYLFPAPTAVLAAMVNHHTDLLASLGATALASTIGFVASVIVGIFFAIALAASVLVRRAFFPYRRCRSSQWLRSW